MDKELTQLEREIEVEPSRSNLIKAYSFLRRTGGDLKEFRSKYRDELIDNALLTPLFLNEHDPIIKKHAFCYKFVRMREVDYDNMLAWLETLSELQKKPTDPNYLYTNKMNRGYDKDKGGIYQGISSFCRVGTMGNRSWGFLSEVSCKKCLISKKIKLFKGEVFRKKDIGNFDWDWVEEVYGLIELPNSKFKLKNIPLE